MTGSSNKLSLPKKDSDVESYADSQLEREREMIDNKINNVKESDFDERSDLAFS